jgi:hypothetical protein
MQLYKKIVSLCFCNVLQTATTKTKNGDRQGTLKSIQRADNQQILIGSPSAAGYRQQNGEHRGG